MPRAEARVGNVLRGQPFCPALQGVRQVAAREERDQGIGFGLRGITAAIDDLIYETVIPGLFGRHESIAIGIFLRARLVFARCASDRSG